jgi:hypothetical protein
MSLPGLPREDRSADERLRSYLYAEPAGSEPPLRVVMVTSTEVPRWVESFLDLAAESRRIEVQVMPVAAGTTQEKSSLPLDLRAFLRIERVLLSLFLSAFRRNESGPLSRISLEPRVGIAAHGSVGDVETVRERLAAFQPDLVLLLGRPEWGETLATCARQGCWIIGADMDHQEHAGMSLLVPILEGQDATPFGLELQLAESATISLGMSWCATRAVSFSQHRDLAFLKLPALLMRALRQIANAGSRTEKGQVAVLRVAPSALAFATGSGMRALGITLRLLSQWRSRKHRANQPWFLLLPQAPSPIDPEAPRIDSYRSLVAPGRDYWADPFPVRHEERRLLFVEEFVDERNLGVICCLELQPDGSVLRHGVVLDEPFHLSYPQVFRSQGQWYMTVESCEANRVSLYRADDFPRGWQRVTDLIHGRVCVDPTLYQHNGHWYLFGNVSESGANPSDELFLFVSDSLEGPYRAHPANPIVSDVRSARPAGQLFVQGGKLIRPAQCCAPIYGSAVVFNEVVELSPHSYAERALSRLVPAWSPVLDGCHTYNRAEGMEVLDAHGEPPGIPVRIEVTDTPSAQIVDPPRGGGKDHGRSRLDLFFAVAMWQWYF